jgi:hypothetical protein
LTANLTARQRWRADVDRYRAYRLDMKGPLKRFRVILLTEGLWAIAMYRFGQYLYFEAPAVFGLCCEFRIRSHARLWN